MSSSKPVYDVHEEAPPDESQTQEAPDASAGVVDELLVPAAAAGESLGTAASFRSATASSPVKPSAASAKAGASSSKMLPPAEEHDELSESLGAAGEAVPRGAGGGVAPAAGANDAAPAEASDDAASSSAGAPAGAAVATLSQSEPPAGAARAGKAKSTRQAGKAPKTRGKAAAASAKDAAAPTSSWARRPLTENEPEGSSPVKTQTRATASPTASAAKKEAEKASAKTRGAKQSGGAAAGKGKGKASKQADEEDSDEAEEEPPRSQRAKEKTGIVPSYAHGSDAEAEAEDASQESTSGASPKKKQRKSAAKAPAAKKKAASKTKTSKAAAPKSKSSSSSRQREPTVGDDSRDVPNVKKRKRAGEQAAPQSSDDLRYPDDEQMDDAEEGEEGEEMEDADDDASNDLDFDDVMAVAALVCELVRPAPSCPSTLARNCLRRFNELRDDDKKLEAYLGERSRTIARALGHALCVFLVPLDLNLQLRDVAQEELEYLLRNGDWSSKALPIVKGKDCKDQANAARVAASIVLRLTVSAIAFGACSIRERKYSTIIDPDAATIWQYHRFTLHPRKKNSFHRFVVKHPDPDDKELDQDDDDDDRLPTLLCTPPLEATLKHHAKWTMNFASFCRVFGLPEPTTAGEATDSATAELLAECGTPRGSAMMGIGMDEADDEALAAHLEAKRELDEERLEFFARHAKQSDPVRFELQSGKEALAKE